MSDGTGYPDGRGLKGAPAWVQVVREPSPIQQAEAAFKHEYRFRFYAEFVSIVRQEDLEFIGRKVTANKWDFAGANLASSDLMLATVKTTRVLKPDELERMKAWMLNRKRFDWPNWDVRLDVVTMGAAA